MLEQVPWRKHINLSPDNLLRDVLKVVFDEDGGSEFWLKYQKNHNLNCIRDIHTEEELKILGDPEYVTNQITIALRDYPVEYYVPKSLIKNKSKLMLSVTGGTTGKEKTAIFNTKGLFEDYGFMGYHFITKHGFSYTGEGYSLLYAGPTGNHYVGKSIKRMAENTNALFYAIDMDTRIFKKFLIAQKYDAVNLYMEHIMEQIVDILKTKKIDCLVTTSKILEELYKYIDVDALGLKMIMNSGTATSPDTLKVFTNEIYKNVIFMGAYGNALFGPSFEIPRKENDYNMRYYSNYPYIQIDVVSKDDLFSKVNYGETGRVLMRRYTPECFIPYYVERDIAERIMPSKENGIFWDGIMNPRLNQDMAGKIVEGVY
ncbi:hypothetical protein [Vallitalea maricola]|uniref:Uncharacterized protein n=1 Tax=Vallitalea maricola TaxID=3074433 RepID=A0ACB5UFC4_9FIRM|nr:hypothetical protein AN2V17_08750 [Vallitalea sp. AN17-2]